MEEPCRSRTDLPPAKELVVELRHSPSERLGLPPEETSERSGLPLAEQAVAEASREGLRGGNILRSLAHGGGVSTHLHGKCEI